MASKIPTFRSAYAADAGKDQQHAYDRQEARRADNRFYCSRPWRKLKDSYKRKHPLCERCRINGLVVETTTIHHKLTRKSRPDLALTWSNLEALCDACHNAEHKRKPRPNDATEDHAQEQRDVRL